jgi:exportin-1
MTQAKTKVMKEQFWKEFSDIFHLCNEVLRAADKPSLISATLNTLLRFLTWIPLGYVFETDLIQILCNRFFQVERFRNIVLKCLTEVASLQVGPEYDEKFVILYQMVIEGIKAIMPLQIDLPNIYEDSSDDDQQFVQNLGMFLQIFFTFHLRPVETASFSRPDIHDALQTGHLYLINVSKVKDREVFKVTLEYWTKLVSELYDELSGVVMENPILNLSGGYSAQPKQTRRVQIYAGILSMLRVVVIESMVRPEEVLIGENDEGEIVRISLKESDTIVLYKSMRELLVYLTHLDTKDTERIMTAKLEKQMDGSEWSWDNLNRLCWAIGSISGAFTEETEKRFLVMVIKDLLSLVEMKRGKDNKAVVASNIMYVVGQYPRFLKAHWKFLKTVVNKLFEFMHELHEGVQDMACDTFMKIAQKCKRHFVIQQVQENAPFIEEILKTIELIISELTSEQKVIFYEAVGTIISSQPNRQFQERLLEMLMDLPNREVLHH